MNKRYIRIDFMIPFNKFEEIHEIIDKIKTIIEDKNGSQIVLTIDSHNKMNLETNTNVLPPSS